MALGNNSLAALINQQMGLDGPTLNTVSKDSVGIEYLWNAFGDALKRARFISFLVSVESEAEHVVAVGRVRQLEAV